MTDISALFDDALAEVDIVHKLTGKPLGIKMWLAPFASDDSANMWFRSMYHLEASGGKAVPKDKVADIATMADCRGIASRVRKWDWGGNSWGELGENPACTMENKLRIFTDPRASFIVEQLMSKAAEIENFTKAPNPD